MKVNRQIVAALLCNLGGCSTGMLVGWLSPAIPQILAPSKPIGEITLEQSAWLAAVFPIVGMLAPLFVKLSDKYGRKICIIYGSIPFAINGILILLAEDVTTLIIGRFVAGFGVANMFCSGPAYIAEIADSDVRGRMGSTFNIMYTSGILMAYSFGGFINYKIAAVVMITIATANFFFFMYMPETPMYLVKNGKEADAMKSIAWLKRVHIKSEVVKVELEYLKETSSKLSMLEAMRLLFSSRPMLYSFGVCVFIFIGQAMTGMFAIHGYSVTIFMEGGTSKITPEEAAVFYASIQVLGAFSTSWLVDRLGRKILVLASFIGIAISMYILGAYFYVKNLNYDVTEYRWITVVALCACVYSYTIGAGGVPYILMSDLIHSEVRSVTTMFVIQLLTSMGFLLLRFFEPVSVSYGRHVIFFFFGTSCIVTTLFSFLFLKETKGLSQHEIMDLNSGFKKTLKINEANENSSKPS